LAEGDVGNSACGGGGNRVCVENNGCRNASTRAKQALFNARIAAPGKGACHKAEANPFRKSHICLPLYVVLIDWDSARGSKRGKGFICGLTQSA